MKYILFCQNNYAFAIFEPIKKVLERKSYNYIWYISKNIENDFPFKSDNYTVKISDLETYKSDVILVPGNEVPYYLRGLKTQIFHGLAGEKKGHFRIRHYFDLYLTQGPYFTKTFNKLKQKYNNFDVIETGWPKLDIYGNNKNLYYQEKQQLLINNEAKKIILYAPTFSPKLTSAPFLIEQIKQLAKTNKDYLILIKFHPLMNKEWIETYTKIAQAIGNIIFITDKSVTKYLLIADILISDTSSVIYEFLLLDKPAITFNNISKNIYWCNSNNFNELDTLVKNNIIEDPYSKSRAYIYQQFHPYCDGKSSERIVEITKQYIEKQGVPNKRKISIFRRMKIHSIFGKATN